MDIEIKSQDIQGLLHDKKFMPGLLTEVTKNRFVQQELAEGLANELSGRLDNYREVSRLLCDEKKLFEMIKKLTLGEREIESVTEVVENKISDIQKLTKRLTATNGKLKAANRKLKEAEKQLLHSDKLAAVGELASGVIHEINNPLGTIKGLVQLLEEEKNLKETQKKDLKTIESEIDRTQGIIEKLRSFSRPNELEIHLININTLIDETIHLMHHKILKQRIGLIKNYERDLPLIKIDGHQIKQVFVNIILNSFQAISIGDSLIITTRLIANEFVEITFKDTGCGIAKKNLGKIFKPFFTTRKEGTGLGLTISQTIIKKHKGTISVKSIVGKGTTFIIKLPVKK